LIFLFKWQPDLKTKQPAVEENAPVYFAQQIINNACATQAMLSILLNQPDTELDIGEQLKQLKVLVHAPQCRSGAPCTLSCAEHCSGDQKPNILFHLYFILSWCMLKSADTLGSSCPEISAQSVGRVASHRMS
jgi:Ubiquitin carboxyl-terminal hydrolase, family 1